MNYLRIYALSAVGSIAVSVICVALDHPRIAVVPIVLSFVLAIAYGDKAAKLRTQTSELQDPNKWSNWVKIARPRQIRLKDNARIARNTIFFFFAVTWANQIIGVFLFNEIRSPALRAYVWISALSFLVGAICLTELWRLTRKAHRLVADGAISIGKVTSLRANGPRRTIGYEFIDNAGLVVVGSGPDAVGSLEVGNSIPVFYNPESPKADHIALCRSPYTLTDNIPSA